MAFDQQPLREYAATVLVSNVSACCFAASQSGSLAAIFACSADSFVPYQMRGCALYVPAVWDAVVVIVVVVAVAIVVALSVVLTDDLIQPEPVHSHQLSSVPKA